MTTDTAPAKTMAETPADTLPDDLATDLDGTFERLVLRYQGRLYAFALRFSGDRRDAEEIAQDAFIRAYTALQGYDAPRIRLLALQPWLYRITLNVARNRARGKRPTLVPLATDEATDRPAAPPLADQERDRPEALTERRELGAALGALVAGLPARYRAAIILRHIEGFSYPEAATILDQPIGTVKANVHRGVGQLRATWLAQQHDEHDEHDENDKEAIHGRSAAKPTR